MQVPYVLCEGLEQVFANLDVSAPIFIDTETDGFYGKIILFQLYQSGLDAVRISHLPNVWELIGYLNQYKSVLYNAHYDITTIQELTGSRWAPSQYEDAFLLARLALPEGDEYTLDAVMAKVLGFDPYVAQKLSKKELQKTNWAKLSINSAHTQLTYAATDVYYLPQVYEAVKHAEHSMSYKLDKLTLNYCLDFQWNGLAIDKAKLNLKRIELKEKIAAANMKININSWQQVRPFIGQQDSDALALMTYWLRDKNVNAKKVYDVRRLTKQLSFLEKFDRSVERIFGKFLPSARSGRLTSKDQNLQQLPRSLKSIFGVDDSRVLIYADYAQIELRTICAITRCTLMEKLFRDGEDLHSYTAAMIFGEDWEPEHRQISKTCNFNLLYGGGVSMFISILIKTAELLLDEPTGYTIRKKWRNLWKEIYAWQEKGIAAWKKGKLGSTPLGRKYSAKMMTDQLNIENQGAAADVFKLALHYFLRDNDLPEDVFICNVIHDSFIIEAPNDPAIYQAVAIKLAKAMQEAWFEMSKLFDIKDLPMPVDVKVGFNWGDIESKDVPNLWEYSLDPYEMLEKVNAEI